MLLNILIPTGVLVPTVSPSVGYRPPVLTDHFSGYRPVCFAKTRLNKLIIVDGMKRGQIWDGYKAAPVELGMDAPLTPPVVVKTAGSGPMGVGTYVFGYRYVDDWNTPSNLSELAEIEITEDDETGFATWTVPYPTQARAEGGRVELYRSTAATTDPVYLVHTEELTGGEVGTFNFVDNTYDDDELVEQPILTIVTGNAQLVARAFDPPPDTKAVVCQFQDRMWYAVDVVYRLGTVAVSVGSTTVTGTGTAWPTNWADRELYVDGATRSYTIASSAATSITLTEPYEGPVGTGLSYAIRPPISERSLLYFSEPDSPEAVPIIQNVIGVQENTGDDDEIVGLMPRGRYLYILKERQIIQLTFVKQPTIDHTLVPVVSRGAFNNRCWDYAEGVGFLMDSQGAYQFSDGSVVPISEPIQDFWRDGVIDFSQKDWFHVGADIEEGVVRFWVRLTTDDDEVFDELPMTALVYHIRKQVWWMETYVHSVGACCRTQIGGRNRGILGTIWDRLAVQNVGLTDWNSDPILGTATAGTSTTLSDSTAAFDDSVLYWPITITSGTGRGQTRLISSVSATQLTVLTEWDTTPDATSTYSIGAIPYEFESGLFAFVEVPATNSRSLAFVYSPTSDTHKVFWSRYLDHRTSPELNGFTFDGNSGVGGLAGESVLTLDLKVAKSSLTGDNEPGYTRIPYGGGFMEEGKGNRWYRYKFTGAQDEDAVVVYEVKQEGIE